VSLFDCRPEGIKPISRTGGTLADTESWESAPPTLSSSPISRFVRTPEGQCIGVARKEGIELQLVSERGTRLVWKEKSPAADGLVVLDRGA
jgi:hypothetical protein